MSALAYALVASGFTATSSLFFRKCGDEVPNKISPSGSLTLYYLFSFTAALFMYSDVFQGKVNWIILAIGGCVGLFSSTVMMFTSRALRHGPAGLTFAFQNASAVFPGLILFLFAGSDFGYSCTYLQLLGMIIVLSGLALGSVKEARKLPDASVRWLIFAVGAFIAQIIALTLIQGRCLLFDTPGGGVLFTDFTASEADDVWFMPGQFGMSLMFQLILFLKEKRGFYKGEAVFGSLAGLANFASTALLLLATKYALPFENGIIFPCFAVGAMILCNLWANRLYQEDFNIRANILCSIGIFMAVSG